MLNIKYTIGSILTLPLLPLMYFQGKKIKASVPNLPEAIGREGKCVFENSSDKTIKVLAIGESTIAGVGVETHDQGFAGTFAKEVSALFQTNADWKVYAQSGYTAKQVNDEILPEITETDIQLIVVGLGGNDAFHLNSPRKWKRNVSKIISNLKQKFPDALIVFCNMPPIKGFPAFTPLIKSTIGNLVEILGEELNSLIKQYDNVFYHNEIITLDKWIKKLSIEGNEADFFSDGVHPSKLAYQAWAKDLALVIRNEQMTSSAIQKHLQ